MKKLGLIINPIAGMGGSVGLKGTDHVVGEAIRRGAVPHAEERTAHALEELLPYRSLFTVYTVPGKMGGDIAQKMGFQVQLMEMSGGTSSESSCEDTVRLAKRLYGEGMDLLLFAGGDGTARDLFQAVGSQCVCVGIPAGVKIHSPVYAKNPRAAGKLAVLWLTGAVKSTSEEEVLDIDEEEYRRELISTRLYGYLTLPREKSLTQNRKAPTPVSETAAIEAIAYEVTDRMEPDVLYLIGAGTTTRGIMQKLGLANTLIGIDLIADKKLIASDVYGKELLKYIEGKKTKLVITVTGGQGYLFGRGNQQLTPEILRAVGKENIIILMTKAKLAALGGRPLLADTFDEELNRSLCGYYRTISGYGEYTMCRVAEL